MNGFISGCCVGLNIFMKATISAIADFQLLAYCHCISLPCPNLKSKGTDQTERDFIVLTVMLDVRNVFGIRWVDTRKLEGCNLVYK